MELTVGFFLCCFILHIGREMMKVVVHGDTLLKADADRLKNITMGVWPGWLAGFLVGLLTLESDVIVGIRVNGGKVVTNGSIQLLERRSSGYRYARPLILWDDIQACSSAEEALALVASKVNQVGS